MQDSIQLPSGRQQNWDKRLKEFALQLLKIQESVAYRMSARGWCYYLEGLGVIAKGDFKKAHRCITECRRKGYLPIDFVLGDSGRRFSMPDRVESETPIEYLKSFVRMPLTLGNSYDLDFWEKEKVFIMMMVEKADLISLFKPICQEYHIPIGNSKGWSSMSQRANIAKKFSLHEEQRRMPVLLYCGDHDPYGLKISDTLMKNFEELEEATGWNPSNLTIDRFGLNVDFINKNGLVWIDNLQSGAGKAPNKDLPFVKDYINKYGERKVEANALMKIADKGIELCQQAIQNYLGADAIERFAEKRKRCQRWFDALLDYYRLRTPLNDAVKKLKIRK